ncbi:hypothetical protein HMPREF2736_10945 [Corynebacterium sp. HMSC036E10]|nr:hypothetical protein HMPREF2736_10945 [Corynebacterium sp. HMSC036E10]PLA38290.1 hypothetical protein CYJ46_04255 [Corynebacterium coyleae]
MVASRGGEQRGVGSFDQVGQAIEGECREAGDDAAGAFDGVGDGTGGGAAVVAHAAWVVTGVVVHPPFFTAVFGGEVAVGADLVVGEVGCALFVVDEDCFDVDTHAVS